MLRGPANTTQHRRESLPAVGACYLGDLHVLDVNKSLMVWRHLRPRGDASWPQPRAYHTATAVDKRNLLVFGGIAALSQGQSSANTSGVAAHDYSHDSEDLRDGAGVIYLNDVWQFSGLSLAWVPIQCRGVEPPVRCAHAAALVPAPPRLLVHGGHGEGGAVLGDLWLLSARN